MKIKEVLFLTGELGLAGAATYGYNDNGCLTSKTDASETTTYQYDYENRLTAISSQPSAVSYKYDYLGRRIKVNNNGAITNYIYDGNRIIAEYDDSGSLICEYVYGNSIDEVLYMIKGSDFYYYHYDGLGSVRVITDGSEITVETCTYDVYGKPAIYDASGTKITESQIGNRNYFTGREFDKESGLYYYRARYYDPTLGRFMSPDPMGPIDGPNLYAYCKNNPLNWVDPYGLVGFPYTGKGWAGGLLMGAGGIAMFVPGGQGLGTGMFLLGLGLYTWDQIEGAESIDKAKEKLKPMVDDWFEEIDELDKIGGKK